MYRAKADRRIEYLLVCRVCGREFIANRFDAKVCGEPCKARRLRGQDLVFLKELRPYERFKALRALARHEQWVQAKREGRRFSAAIVTPSVDASSNSSALRLTPLKAKYRTRATFARTGGFDGSRRRR